MTLPPLKTPTSAAGFDMRDEHRITTVEDLVKAFAYLRRLTVFPQFIETQTYGYGAIELQPQIQALARCSLLGIGCLESSARGLEAGPQEQASEIVPIKIRHNGETRDFYMLHYRGDTLAVTPATVVDLGHGLARTCADPDFDNRKIHVWLPVPTQPPRGDDYIEVPALALARQTPKGLERLKILRDTCFELFRETKKPTPRQSKLAAPGRPANGAPPPPDGPDI